MIKKVLIIGSGSIQKTHVKVLRLINKNIIIHTIPTRKNLKSELKTLKKFNPEYIVVCSPSSFHYRHFLFIEKNFQNKIVLIEKPLFIKFYSIDKNLNNKYFVGYNLRFHPVITYLKNFLKKKNILSINVISHSFLPSWRKKNYKHSVSAKKKLGGGVLLELSHELDFLKWLFKKIKILQVYNKQISKLKINTDDILNLSGKVNNKSFFNLNINFFSRINCRKIKVDGNNFSIEGDLINNIIKIVIDDKEDLKIFKNFDIKNTFRSLHLELMSQKLKHSCTIFEGLELMKLIDKIKVKNI
jgi:predicted dehydrogenase